MAYTRHTWVCGETITADKMNHIEDGIAEGGGALVVHITEDPDFSTTPPVVTYIPDKTYDEINAAYEDGKVIVAECTSMMGSIFTKKDDGTENFYSTNNTLVAQVGARATITQVYFQFSPDNTLTYVENRIKVEVAD